MNRLLALCLFIAPLAQAAAPSSACLPGELSADAILDGAYPFPPTPAYLASDLTPRLDGFDSDRLGVVPAPGVHPRLLISPGQLPELRRRLKETNVGRALFATLRERTDDALRNPKNWSTSLYNALAAGDTAAVNALLAEHKGLPPGIGHYQPWIYALVLESFDALVSEDAARGQKVATAIATYSTLLAPGIDRALSGSLADDVFRAKTSGPVTGTGVSDQGMRDGVGGHLLGYAYDFAYDYMTEAQRAEVRGVIARATAGKLWMGARLPRHFRNWNWVAIGLQQPLLALSIEGEPGYDPRVYRLGVEIARDYLTYAISPAGMSTEAVGYTQFGLVWGNPFFVAATRRGENLLAHPHHRAMVDWYLHSTEPDRNAWVSHGDGGDRGPAIWTLSMWRYFFPRDAKIAALWRSFMLSEGGTKALTGKFHLIEPLLWADADPALNDPKLAATQDPAELKLPATLFDPLRSSLIARSDWTPGGAMFQFECRTDSVGGSHEHADRGAFTLSALGRSWAKDNFRSVETRHHNSVLIDGLGQGYWPGPGRWLGLAENADALIAACDVKDAYDWMWPKQILTENPDTFIRFNYPRWESYREEARKFQAARADQKGGRETRPGVVAFWQGFADVAGGPRLWDEDGWPVRFPHNPVQRAFRTVLFVRGPQPYAVIVDDIQKDKSERLYEWLMQTGPNTELASLATDDAILCDATVKRTIDGLPKPAKGDRQLLVRVLDMNDPAAARDYTSRPSIRLDTFERKDTLEPENKTGALAGSRSFGLDKRLVIPSRSAAPDFKIMLFPHRAGDALPVTTWNADRTVLTVQLGTLTDVIRFNHPADGRTRLSFVRADSAPLVLP